MGSQITQQDRALVKAVAAVEKLLQESPGGCYISQITGAVQISSDLAKSALRSLNAVEENGLWCLPDDEPAIEIELKAAPQPAQVPKKSMPEKLNDYLKSMPNGVSKAKLMSDLGWTQQQLKDALRDLRKYQPVASIDDTGIPMLRLPPKDPVSTAALAAPVVAKSAPEPVQDSTNAEPAPVIVEPEPTPEPEMVAEPVVASGIATAPKATQIVSYTTVEAEKAWVWMDSDGKIGADEFPTIQDALDEMDSRITVDKALAMGFKLAQCNVVKTYHFLNMLQGVV